MEKITIINSKKNKLSIFLDIKNVFSTPYLLTTLFKRDIISVYRQTILGPIWFVLTPIITTLVFTVVFGNIGQMSTDDVNPFIFYFSGLILWNFFISLVGKSANIFGDNHNIFSKIYFPKFSVFFVNFFVSFSKFFIQYVVYIGFLIYFSFYRDLDLSINIFLPINIILLTLYLFILTSGIGMIISATMVKYKDVMFMYNFILNLVMYVTPILFPLSSVEGKLKILMYLNPVTLPVELVKIIHLGKGQADIFLFFSNVSITIVLFIIGYIFFKKTEQTYIDTF